MNILEAMDDPNVFAPHFKGPSWKPWKAALAAIFALPMDDDEALATYLEWERQDFQEAVEGIRNGHEDVAAGRVRPAAEFLSQMRRKHDFPR